MKVVLLADGFVGTEITRFIMDSYCDDLVMIVTTEINDIYREAESKGVPLCVFDSEKNVLDRIGEKVDLGLMAWWPKILKDPLLSLPRQGFINTHPSLLPYNRGKHYNFWALVEQVPFGVTLHRVDSGIDTGDIIAQNQIGYDWCDTGETLYKKAQIAMLDLFRNTYPLLRKGQCKSKPQNIKAGSFHHASELDLASKIDLNSQVRVRDFLNVLRARTFEGHPGCWFEESGSRYEISVKIRKVN